MKKFKTLIAVTLVISMVAVLAVGCKKEEKEAGNDKKEAKMFTMFNAVPGTEIPDDNRMLNVIKEKTGAWAKMTWLTGQTADERIGVMIAGGDYPDFITGATGTPALIDAGALIAIDEYWDDYPNIKNYLSEEDWNKVRHEDGHIYLMPQFGIIQGKDMATYHWDMAFWIQKDVLIWDNFPQIRTMDQYFDLIARYLEAHPTTEDGQETVGFSMSTEDWRYFGVENPPLFLLGYPNDGACIVDPETETAIDYNTLPEAKDYYKRMSQAWNDGLVHPETYTMSYDQYIALLSTGRVLGTLDQRWNFNTANEALVSEGKVGKTYVPLPITFNENIKDRWHSSPALDVSNGLSITKSCKDIEGALQFVNDLLSPEIMTLRYWGEEGVDYEVGEDGVFYKTPEQRANYDNQDWATDNLCKYDYFPHYEGMLADGINAQDPKNQPNEFYETLYDVEKQLLDGYGYKTFLDFLSSDEKNEPWYPMWSATNAWTNDTPEGLAKTKITDLKHEWLPKAMMAPADEFDAIWDEYQAIYKEEVDVDAYLDALTAEIRRRAAVARGE
ncbi:sugar ABC transporter substrate-binding protein [Mobilitalea sibirica]|uniref:Sugar ABC transporter substrate-binding protein n=1 Tax=Mobilitalea sibirica TaxID=1462919 RepID=A0A8J7H0Y1_9FIRM|nr:extracellular solute-binding protein [Mobilitalea sibirica]MBH1942234.1 sugar ABC transporter substrate-binding protein [Mobilitalea sibirica]